MRIKIFILMRILFIVLLPFRMTVLLHPACNTPERKEVQDVSITDKANLCGKCGYRRLSYLNDLWAKDISPSTYLRKWFNHEEALYPKFREQYREELEKNPDKDDFIKTVKEQLTKDNVTLLFGAKEEKLNQATVLKEWLEEKM